MKTICKNMIGGITSQSMKYKMLLNK